jgi:pimeloyl-ACP methyl ester carboxylesterase
MSESRTFAIRDLKQDRALILIHGFGGNSHVTFGLLPAFLAGHPSLYGWDIHCFGYPTSLSLDISGVWRANPDLTKLAGYLSAHINQLGFARYQRLALVAHSMGGLIVQRAVLDGNFAGRVSHLSLFGTPSMGLRKAGLVRLFNLQARDMAFDGPFITKLRTDWTTTFAGLPPFKFCAVAGIKDEFVPAESSVDVFDKSLRSYVEGDHLEMVKPATASADIVQLLLHLLGPEPERGSAGALLSKYQTVVDRLLPTWRQLDDAGIKDLVFALEGLGRQQQAIDILEEIHTRSTELMGILAGRLKRRWLADPEVRHDDGLRARKLYGEAFSIAEGKNNHAQAYYNGINHAFMVLALDKDRDGARRIAVSVLPHTAAEPEAVWHPPG